MSAEVRAREEPIAGRYWLQRQLAVGGMAEIWLARHTEGDFEKDLVIKRLRPELASDERVLAMFADECYITGLFGHSNVVSAFDAGVHDGRPFLALEHVRGEELSALCRRGLSLGHFLPMEHAIELIRQAALAMGYFHNLRASTGVPLEIVHCDVSPTNILINEDGHAIFIDFGISQFSQQSYRDQRVVPGKLSYMSPEQAKRGRLDRRSDIFSLGIVLYEICLGKRLFRGPAREVYQRVSRGEVEPPTFVHNDFPGALESIIMRCLDAEPSERYQDAYELADALGEYIREERFRTGPLAIARYLDQLHVSAGNGSREELHLAAEEDEEGLDFDRGLFAGRKADAEPDPKAAADWDEVEETESAVADVLGIAPRFVRIGARTTREQAAQPIDGEGGEEEDPYPEPSSGSSLAPEPAVQTPEPLSPEPAVQTPESLSPEPAVQTPEPSFDSRRSPGASGGEEPVALSPIAAAPPRVLDPSSDLPVGRAPQPEASRTSGARSALIIGLIVGAGLGGVAYYLLGL